MEIGKGHSFLIFAATVHRDKEEAAKRKNNQFMLIYN